MRLFKKKNRIQPSGNSNTDGHPPKDSFFRKCSRSQVAGIISVLITFCLLLTGGAFVLFGMRRPGNNASKEPTSSEIDSSDQNFQALFGLGPITRILTPDSDGTKIYTYSDGTQLEPSPKSSDASAKTTTDDASKAASAKADSANGLSADNAAAKSGKTDDSSKENGSGDKASEKDSKKKNSEDKKDSKSKSEKDSKKKDEKDKVGVPDSLTKAQQQYIANWEAIHYRTFPLNTGLHDYNWKYLEYDEKGVLQYKGDDDYTVRRGIDVSEFQGQIDWDKVKKAGYDFVFVRAGHRTFHTGSLERDTRALKNLTRAKKAGLDVGVYVFSQAITIDEAIEEAELCLDVIEESKVKITLPVVFDPEIQLEYDARINYISSNQFTDNAVAFCETIKKAGYTPAIYANCSTETDILNMARLENAEIWYADYGSIPESPYRFTFWQYTSKGWVDGIPETETDLNLWFIKKE